VIIIAETQAALKQPAATTSPLFRWDILAGKARSATCRCRR